MTSVDAEFSELLDSLRAHPAETEWLEFKANNADPVRLGRYLSALANSAAYLNRSAGFLVFGVDDSSHEVVGTSFDPHSSKYKKQSLIMWLHSLTNADFDFLVGEHLGKRVVIVEVRAAMGRPIEFAGTQYIRVGSSLTELRTDPNREGRLWDILRNVSFEESIAQSGVPADQVLRLLDLESYYARSNTLPPDSSEELLKAAVALSIISVRDDGRFDITNLGALLFARDLSRFPSVDGKAIRVVQYAGTDRTEVSRRQDGVMGYAVGFTSLLTWVKALLPAREVYVNGVRQEELVYSDLLLREAFANALIHQDLTVRGAGPKIEVFSDRIEVTNPGAPLIAVDRLLNSPPVSRNTALAKLMRQMRLCEDYGTGWDRIASETERAGLPAPMVETHDNSTRVSVLGPRKLTSMPRAEQLWAVYLHACLQWASKSHLTNSSLRQRFGIASSNTAQVSRLIGLAVEAGHIVVYDETVGNKAKSYVPYWAK